MNAADLDLSQSHPLKARQLRIARAVFVGFDELPTWQQAWLMADVQDVRDGRTTPWLSPVERERAEAAWKAEETNG